MKKHQKSYKPNDQVIMLFQYAFQKLATSTRKGGIWWGRIYPEDRRKNKNNTPPCKTELKSKKRVKDKKKKKKIEEKTSVIPHQKKYSKM